MKNIRKIKLSILLSLAILTIGCAQNKEKKLEEQKDKKEISNAENQKLDAQRIKYLIAVLDTINRDEQTPIRLRDELMEKHGVDSEKAQEYQEIYTRNHIINEKKVTEILDEYGWLGSDIIGDRGNTTLYLVVQHSGFETRTKYLPMLRKAVKTGNTPPRYLGNIEDRTASDLGKMQVYGEQMKYYPETKSFNVWPVYDPTNIDKRRAEIGLIPITGHLKNRFDFEWDLEEQIKRTAEFEKERIKKINSEMPTSVIEY
jgi:hypothetical protein